MEACAQATGGRARTRSASTPRTGRPSSLDRSTASAPAAAKTKDLPPLSSRGMKAKSSKGHDPSRAGTEQYDTHLQSVARHVAEITIDIPGQDADELAEALLDSWPQHQDAVRRFWLSRLTRAKRKQLLDTLQQRVKSVLQTQLNSQEADFRRAYQLCGRVFERLHWNNGQGMWNCFCLPDLSWDSISSIVMLSSPSAPEKDFARAILHRARVFVLLFFKFAMEMDGSGGQLSTLPAAHSLVSTLHSVLSTQSSLVKTTSVTLLELS
eukprot:m.188247 g.188247  ORF g.188247 m.188247 type:complete len:267 (+) comp21640_c7_seq6:904-1704(+)